MRRLTGASAAALLVAGIAAIGTIGPVSTAEPVGAAATLRPSDPVVLTGAQIPVLVDGPRATILGFRWTGSAWVQIPVQVDERAVVNFAKIYRNVSPSFYGSQPGLVSKLVYTSPTTFTGPDPNKLFDADDELAFMARDAGATAPPTTAPPTGTVLGTGVRIHVTDPLDATSDGDVYLFRKAPGSYRRPNAGTNYVRYVFKLLAGNYKKMYNLTGGPNLENSLVTAPNYTWHFGDRWLSDAITVKAGGATGVDILDRHKALFAPGQCIRSEDTFDMPIAGSSEGAFVANINGPVRAIRSWIGANSGPNTQRTQIFYDRRAEIVTDLRVHSIPSIMDFFDYSPAASGMTFRNAANPSGVTIDGVPDALSSAPGEWEQVTGAQGTVSIVSKMTADFTLSASGYYLDDSTPPDTQCTGDAFSYGASGTQITSSLPCTDPGLGCSNSLQTRRVLFFDPPGGTAADAVARHSEVSSPLAATATAWP